MINNSLEGLNMFNKCRKTTAKPPINVSSISTFNKVNTGLRINFFSIRKEPIPIENIYNPTVTLYLKTVFSRKADKDWASNNSYIMLQKAKTKVIVKRMAKIPLNLFKHLKPGPQGQVRVIRLCPMLVIPECSYRESILQGHSWIPANYMLE